jgi:hypothetical protein
MGWEEIHEGIQIHERYGRAEAIRFQEANPSKAGLDEPITYRRRSPTWKHDVLEDPGLDVRALEGANRKECG